MKAANLIQRIVFLMILSGLRPAWGAIQTLPDALIHLPVSEHAIVVEKKSQTLYLYSAQKDGVKLMSSYPCSTGESAGPKKQAGDKKTPEGVYFLKDEYEDRYLTPVYGKKAFPSDYPNFLDLRQGRQGSAIWIHGTDKPLKPMDSNGCVALENKSIQDLAKYIRLDSTPLIIVEQVNPTDITVLSVTRQKVLGLINRWRTALITGDYHEYLSFYSPDYLPDISWWEKWLKIRNLATKQDRGLVVSVENEGIYAQGNTVVVLMDMAVATEEARTYLGKRELFIQMTGGRPLIVGDLFLKRAKSGQSEEFSLVAAATQLTQKDTGIQGVVKTVEQWMAAWSAKDMKAYSTFYANDFSSDGLGKKAWVERKKSLANRYKYIHVSGKDYKVVRKKDGVEVSFFQNYESSAFSTQGTKQLKMVKKGGGWKIFRENWKKN